MHRYIERLLYNQVEITNELDILSDLWMTKIKSFVRLVYELKEVTWKSEMNAEIRLTYHGHIWQPSNVISVVFGPTHTQTDGKFVR